MSRRSHQMPRTQGRRIRVSDVEPARDVRHELFLLLQQVAGRLPHESVAHARSKLPTGHLAEAARDIVGISLFTDGCSGPGNARCCCIAGPRKHSGAGGTGF
jgi:hypothetical protein